MKIKLLNSPNYGRNTRPKKTIKFVIIHYTGMQSEIESLNKLKDYNSNVSCHYLIGRKGNVIQLVKDSKIAWHAGKSRWKEFRNLNKNSIGIELVNKGHNFGYEKFSFKQIKSLKLLCKKIKKKYKIPENNFLGHSDIAPLRKIDPGEKFPWKNLSKIKIGSWYFFKKRDFLEINNISKLNQRRLFFKNLHKIGYRYFSQNKKGKKDNLVIKAFQRRYLPDKVTGEIDKKTLKISLFFAKKYNLS